MQTTSSDYYGNVNPTLLGVVDPLAQRVAEFGCGAGALARAVRQRCNARVHYVGVELMADELAKAHEVLDVALVRNLDQTPNWSVDAELMAALRSFRAMQETAPGERRVALTPETTKKLVALGARVLIERGAGLPAHFPDAAYAGAEFTDDADAAIAQADVLACVQPPANARLAKLRPGAIVVGLLAPHADPARVVLTASSSEAYGWLLKLLAAPGDANHHFASLGRRLDAVVNGILEQRLKQQRRHALAADRRPLRRAPRRRV